MTNVHANSKIRRWALRSMALLALLAGQHAAAAGELRPLQAPSSRVVLDLPQSYEPSTMFAGFMDQRVGSSVVVVEMPESAFEELEAGMTSEALAQKGIINARRLTLGRPDRHLYMRGEQVSQAGDYEKFFVVVRERGVTALVTANVPKSAIATGEIASAEIERSLKSIRVVDTPAPLRDLFRLKDLGPFKPAGQRLGTARIFTLDGQTGPRDGAAGRPMLIVAPSLDRRTVPMMAEHAERLLAGLPGLTEVRIIERRTVTIAGMPGIEIEARAQDREAGLEIAVLQTLMTPPEGGYFRIVGQVASGEADRYLPEFRRIAETFEIVR